MADDMVKRGIQCVLAAILSLAGGSGAQLTDNITLSQVIDFQRGNAWHNLLIQVTISTTGDLPDIHICVLHLLCDDPGERRAWLSRTSVINCPRFFTKVF